MSDNFKPVLIKAADGQALNAAEASAAFGQIMSGAVEPVQIAAFLTALKIRGETVEEIAEAARAMRAHAVRVTAPEGAIDTCGTGGDASGTYNISTAAAFILAGLGLPVAKHGNRAQSSKSGSADVLSALGVNLELDPAAVGRCISEAGIGFLFAPQHHTAMKHVGPVRAALGFRTIFNLLGPLTNPAGVKLQVVGVFAERWVEPLARVLLALGAERGWVVHGSDGLDELTTTGASHVAEIDEGRVRRFSVTPEEAGLTRALPSALKGGDAAHNAQALKRLLEGEHGPYRDIAVLNAAAALVVARRAANLRDGAALSQKAIDDGRARAALERLIIRSQALKSAIA